ncbi:MAG: M23 family metallopeptidase, partial [Cyanobacteria bacterium P01_A01_bin.68]
RNYLIVLFSYLSIISVVFFRSNSVILPALAADCPLPAIERFQSHQVNSGESLKSIAAQYDLQPETIVRMNPDISGRNLAVGEEILIPPFNGKIVRVSPNQTWKQLAAIHKIRADVLFEVNGCQKNPTVVFIPQLNKSSRATTNQSSPNVTSTPKSFGYPLQDPLKVGFPYGWQIHPTTKEVFFHSGIDLLASNGTSVQAIAPGAVVFAGEQASYGNLIIINHDGGLQSRYAHLESIKLDVGQKVNQGDLLGTVGSTGEPTIKRSHLHFEIRSSSSLGWVAKDPKEYLSRKNNSGDTSQNQQKKE